MILTDVAKAVGFKLSKAEFVKGTYFSGFCFLFGSKLRSSTTSFLHQ